MFLMMNLCRRTPCASTRLRNSVSRFRSSCSGNPSLFAKCERSSGSAARSMGDSTQRTSWAHGNARASSSWPIPGWAVDVTDGECTAWIFTEEFSPVQRELGNAPLLTDFGAPWVELLSALRATTPARSASTQATGPASAPFRIAPSSQHQSLHAAPGRTHCRTDPPPGTPR